MVWETESGAIKAVAEDINVAQSIRDELNSMPANGEQNLSLLAKVQIAKYGIRVGHLQYNEALWIKNSRKLNTLFAKASTCSDVGILFEGLSAKDQEIYLDRRGHNNFNVYVKFKKVMNNPHASATSVFQLWCLDQSLFSTLLSSHPQYRQKFLSVALEATGYLYKSFLDFIVTHRELAADFNDHLDYIVSNPQSNKESITSKNIRTQLAFGGGVIRQAVRNNPKYFSADPDLYVKLLAKEQSRIPNRIDVEARTSLVWRIKNALKFLIPRFLRDLLNIEPPLLSREFTKLHEILHPEDAKVEAKVDDKLEAKPSPIKGIDPYKSAVLQPAPDQQPDQTYVQTPVKSADSGAFQTEDSGAYQTPPPKGTADITYVQTPVEDSRHQPEDSGAYQTYVQSLNDTSMQLPSGDQLTDAELTGGHKRTFSSDEENELGGINISGIPGQVH